MEYGMAKGGRTDIECALNKVIQREMQRRGRARLSKRALISPRFIRAADICMCTLCNVTIGYNESVKPISCCCSLLRSQ